MEKDEAAQWTDEQRWHVKEQAFSVFVDICFRKYRRALEGVWKWVDRNDPKKVEEKNNEDERNHKKITEAYDLVVERWWKPFADEVRAKLQKMLLDPEIISYTEETAAISVILGRVEWEGIGLIFVRTENVQWSGVRMYVRPNMSRTNALTSCAWHT